MIFKMFLKKFVQNAKNIHKKKNAEKMCLMSKKVLKNDKNR